MGAPVIPLFESQLTRAVPHNTHYLMSLVHSSDVLCCCMLTIMPTEVRAIAPSSQSQAQKSSQVDRLESRLELVDST
jgi:hypothetical protein